MAGRRTLVSLCAASRVALAQAEDNSHRMWRAFLEGFTESQYVRGPLYAFQSRKVLACCRLLSLVVVYRLLHGQTQDCAACRTHTMQPHVDSSSYHFVSDQDITFTKFCNNVALKCYTQLQQVCQVFEGQFFVPATITPLIVCFCLHVFIQVKQINYRNDSEYCTCSDVTFGFVASKLGCVGRYQVA